MSMPEAHRAGIALGSAPSGSIGSSRMDPGPRPQTDADDPRNGSIDASVPARLRAHWPLLAIAALGFALRLAWLLYAQPTPVSDWHAYRQLAADLLDHRQFGYPERTTFYLPMHPFHLALWSLVSRSAAWLGFSSVVLSTATIGLVYAVARRLFADVRSALISAALFAVLPLFVLFSPVLATEHLFIALMLSSILCLLHLTGRSWHIAAAAGLFAGAAILTRGEGVFYVPALVLFIWVGTSGASWKDRLWLTAALGAGIAVIVMPWYVRNSAIARPETGLSDGAGINFYFAHNDSGTYGWYPEGSPFEGLDSDEANRLGWELGLAYLRENPLASWETSLSGRRNCCARPSIRSTGARAGWCPAETRSIPASFVENPIRFDWAYDFVLAVPVLLVLGAAALLAYRRWPHPVVWLVAPLIVSSWLLRTVLYWAKPRYGYFIHVMLVFVAAIALAAIIDANRSTRREASPGT